MSVSVMEQHARTVMREALYVHYVEGLREGGELVEAWLREHKGWFPDQQERYDDPFPVDEGLECHSRDPELAVREALNISRLLLRVESESDPDCCGWFYDNLRAFVEAALTCVDKRSTSDSN